MTRVEDSERKTALSGSEGPAPPPGDTSGVAPVSAPAGTEGPEGPEGETPRTATASASSSDALPATTAERALKAGALGPHLRFVLAVAGRTAAPIPPALASMGVGGGARPVPPAASGATLAATLAADEP